MTPQDQTVVVVASPTGRAGVSRWLSSLLPRQVVVRPLHAGEVQQTCLVDLEAARAGFREWNGGVVRDNPFRGAHTTAAAVAWFEDPAGRLHARMAVNRVATRNGHAASAFPVESKERALLVKKKAFPLLVYAGLLRVFQLAAAPPSRQDYGGFGRALVKNPAEATAWAALADWLDEQGFPAEDVRRRQAALIRSAYLGVCAPEEVAGG